MLDSDLVGNKVMSEAKGKKRGCLVFKANFQKAYDTTKWSFLYHMIIKLGFCSKWISWIVLSLELLQHWLMATRI